MKSNVEYVVPTIKNKTCIFRNKAVKLQSIFDVFIVVAGKTVSYTVHK